MEKGEAPGSCCALTPWPACRGARLQKGGEPGVPRARCVPVEAEIPLQHTQALLPFLCSQGSVFHSQPFSEAGRPRAGTLALGVAEGLGWQCPSPAWLCLPGWQTCPCPWHVCSLPFLLPVPPCAPIPVGSHPCCSLPPALSPPTLHFHNKINLKIMFSIISAAVPSLGALPSAAPILSPPACAGAVSDSIHPSDYSKGFGGRYGVERDKVDKAAVGFDYKSQAEKHDSQKDYSVGFGGKFGVQRDRQDKNALGWDHQEEVQPHASQTDYAKGFGGRYGVQKDRVDKSAAGFDEMAAPTSSYEKTRPLEAEGSSGASSLRARFEHMAQEEGRRQEEQRARRRQQQVSQGCLAVSLQAPDTDFSNSMSFYLVS
uniref:Uncharacterized protein n=1 Tax=Ficedula albicollis TaxID=59894 RepID=U3K7M6_FICAL